MDNDNLLSIKMQGNLYEHISARYVSLCDEIFVNIDYYTVNQGKVYIIEKDTFGNDRLTATGDILRELDATGKNIGSYKPNLVERKALNISTELFKSKLGL